MTTMPPQKVTPTSAAEPALARPNRPLSTPARLEADATRIEHLERRIDGLDARLDALMKIEKPNIWVAPAVSAAGAAATTTVALLGFGIVHWLSVRRQGRDEFFKRIQACETIISSASIAAANIWRTGGKAHEPKAVQELLDQVTDVTERLSLLTTLQPRFQVTKPLAEFRKQALLDIEDTTRAPDAFRADATLRTGRSLARAMNETYNAIFR